MWGEVIYPNVNQNYISANMCLVSFCLLLSKVLCAKNTHYEIVH